MANATIIASAVAVLVVIAAVVAIAMSLTEKAADGTSYKVLNVPSAYTAGFSVVWRDSMGERAATGFTTSGTVSVAGAALSFKTTSSKNGAVEATSTFTDGLLYGQTGAAGAFCIGTYTPMGISQISQADANANIQAVAVSDASGACDGATYSVSAFGADHVLCVKNGALVWAQGGSYVLTITSFRTTATEIAAPGGADMKACTNKDGAIVSGGRRMLSGSSPVAYPSQAPELTLASADAWFTADHARNLAERRLQPAGVHVCFMHGMGRAGVAGGVMASNGADYWGNVQGYMNIGSWVGHYIDVDTVNRGWNDVGLQNQYVAFIKNNNCKVVFAHSMGNLILAAANQNGANIKWYQVQGPQRGSWGASGCAGMCSNSVTRFVANLVGGYCDANGNPRSAVQSLVVTGYSTWRDSCSTGSCPWQAGGAHELSWSTCTCGWFCVAGQELCADSGATKVSTAAYESKILGRLCGTGSYGTGGGNGIGLAAIDACVDGVGIACYGEPNDGMVSISSCAASNDRAGNGLNSYLTTTASYKGNMNHADGTCRSGDGAGGDQKACSWFYYMVAYNTVNAF